VNLGGLLLKERLGAVEGTLGVAEGLETELARFGCFRLLGR